MAKGLHVCEKSFEMCSCLQQFDCPEVTLFGWQDIKIELLTNCNKTLT